MRKLLLLFIFFSAFEFVNANNIQVSNVSGIGPYIKFDISWENSWADATNWDAAWVFVKYRYGTSGTWQHAHLNTNGHTFPSICAINTPSDGMGCFISRSTMLMGMGYISFPGIMLSWNVASDGITSYSNLHFNVFAIEMVYVPEGSFWLGDGSSTGSFRQTGSNTPVQVTTGTSVVKCSTTSYDDTQLMGNGILIDGDGGIDKDSTVAVDNPDFPTGYKAFYCMKYEISQGQWASFLNSLTATQAATNYYASTSNRYTISGSWPNFTASAPDRACNFLSWPDGCAYADWAGLRPMTELEFEKACRGNLTPVAGEYAWGTTGIASSVYTLINNGLQNEGFSNLSIIFGNALCSTTNNINGPVRCGIFAYSAGSDSRISTGGTEYGIMEMSGDLWERCVSLGNITGRSFTGNNGDGILSSSGIANQSTWPGTGASGAGFRGGNWHHTAGYMGVSHRIYAANTDASRNSYYGFRCVRSVTYISQPTTICNVTVNDYDGNVYNVIQIGNQCWMKENLKTTHYSDGTALVDGTNAGSILYNYFTKYWFVYNNQIAYESTYGLLYTWAAVMNGAASSYASPSGVQGICPTGWHVPSSNELTSLTYYLGGNSVAGGKLKEAGISHWSSPNTGATNESGFTALPGGYRHYLGIFFDIGYSGHWWSATENNATNASFRDLSYDNTYISGSSWPKNYGFSVRCLRDYW
jgi:uncharacterized protein (TIGR02145 family)